jgi:hypothetical protein
MSRRNACVPALSEELMRDLMEIEERIQASSGRRHVADDPGHVYVILFGTGVVKVGKAVNPRSRIAQHAMQARIHGVEIAESWTSGRHPRHGRTERQLIDHCASHGQRITAGNEYFTGLSFEAARDFAISLIAAVNGDMHATWEEAQAALDGGA